jgi:hypothetical protein
LTRVKKKQSSAQRETDSDLLEHSRLCSSDLEKTKMFAEQARGEKIVGKEGEKDKSKL